MQQMMIDVEDKTFPQLMYDIVLQPLGMIHSTYDQPLTKDKVSLAATGYLPDGTMTKGKFHTYPEMAAAGLWTTAEDLAKFAIDVQNTVGGKSTKVLSKQMSEKMLTPFVADFQGLGFGLTRKKNDFYFDKRNELFGSTSRQPETAKTRRIRTSGLTGS
jgi:CubicO group peptidase (beta-lactamase class C family)